MKKVLKLNKNKVFYIIMGVLLFSVVAATGVKLFIDFRGNDEKEVVTKKKLDSLDVYGYTLDDLDTDTYKKYFNELREVLNKDDIDYKEYASVLTKLFVTDFYTLDNKITSSDIGGEEFVHSDVVDNFKLNAGDTMYNHVKNNVYGDRTQELPEVNSVSIESTEEVKYTYNKKEYEAYKVTASWDYVKDLGYEKNGVFYLIKDNNKLNIVETN